MLRAFGGRAAAAPVVLPLAWWLLASESAEDMAPIRADGFGYMYMPCLGAPTPQIKLRFSTKFDQVSIFSLVRWI